MILDNKNAVHDVRIIKPKKKLRLKRSGIAILLFVNIIFPELCDLFSAVVFLNLQALSSYVWHPFWHRRRCQPALFVQIAV